jgi:hypothetical protein
MKCPVCDVELLMTEKLGVEIEYCPKCRGIWLDRGELEKVIERSAVDPLGAPVRRVSQENYRAAYDPRGQYRQPSHYGHHGKQQDPRYYDHKKRKRQSVLEELFDFGD